MGHLIPFEPTTTRRRPLRDDEPRGILLLFTGVRYERMADPPPVPDSGSDGRPRQRRRRGA